ncbi:MAG TPA: GNAT family N-acetyltransferase [Anaerolineales bacterium]|nr:GNAT family N-acetyltransferase [Anaerolineales bacterium]
MDKELRSPVLIREAEIPADYQNIIHLWKTAGTGIHLRKSDSLEEILKKQARDPDLFLVAEIKDLIVGAVLGGFDGRRGIVYHLAVAAEFRKIGIGENLMQELEKRLKARGCIRSYLLLVPDNMDALSFYKNRNWDILDLVVMGKDL